jgi:hypothetical protein
VTSEEKIIKNKVGLVKLAETLGNEVQGVSVRCLSPEVQVLCHAHGYVPTEKDLRDMELLKERFGVELPPHLRCNKV